jgi:hypothetical protein
MLQFLGMLAAITLTTLCWGAYGPVLHLGHPGRPEFADALKSFICVGAAYFGIAIVVPLLLLARGGERGAWTTKGVVWSLLAGVCGAGGALGVILALNAFGGKPIYVMPLIYGGAPVVNTLLTAFLNRGFDQLKAPFLAGLLLVITGAVTVLVFRPAPQVATAATAAEATAAATGATAGPAADVRPAVASAARTAERWVERLLAVALALCSWGAYGPVLHRGQSAMGGSRLRPLLCIGAAYFLIAVLVPLAILVPMGKAGGWHLASTGWSVAAGCLGAIGALGTILAFTCGGKPFTVMPVVFGCAPVVNTLLTIALAHTPAGAVSPFFLAGMLVVGVGAATVLAFGPRGHAPAPAAPAAT